MSLTNLICITDYVEECVAGWVCGSRRGLSHLTEFLSGADNSALAHCLLAWAARQQHSPERTPGHSPTARQNHLYIKKRTKREDEDEPNAAFFIALSKRWRRSVSPAAWDPVPQLHSSPLCVLSFCPLCLINEPQIRALFCKHRKSLHPRKKIIRLMKRCNAITRSSS